MKPRTRASIVCLLAVTAATGCHWWNSPERQIRRVLDAIADRLSHEAPVTGLAAAAAAAGLQEHLAPDVVIDTDSLVLGLTGRDAAVAAAARLIASTPVLRVQFVDVSLSGGAGEDTGAIEVACNVTVEATDRAGQRTTDARELSLTMRHFEGRWVVGRARTVRIMEPVS